MWLWQCHVRRQGRCADLRGESQRYCLPPSSRSLWGVRPRWMVCLEVEMAPKAKVGKAGNIPPCIKLQLGAHLVGSLFLTFRSARRSLQKWRRGALWISRGVLLSNPAWFPTVAHPLFLPQSHECVRLQVQTAVCAQNCVCFQRPPLCSYDVILKILQKISYKKNTRCQFCDQ